jgi:hypothetical protein
LGACPYLLAVYVLPVPIYWLFIFWPVPIYWLFIFRLIMAFISSVKLLCEERISFIESAIYNGKVVALKSRPVLKHLIPSIKVASMTRRTAKAW